MPGTDDEVVETAIERVLAAVGPLSEDDLLQALVADGVVLGPDPGEALARALGEALDDPLNADSRLVVALADDRFAQLPALLEGRIFTHRLSAFDVQHDLIPFGADLAPVAMLCESPAYQRLTDGSLVVDSSSILNVDVLTARGFVEEDLDIDGALLFEPGRFASLGVAAGGLVALRVTAAGFELSAVHEVSASGLAPALAVLLDERPDEPEMIDVAVWTLCAGDDALFREPAAPLVELLSDGGFEMQGDWVARPGFDIGFDYDEVPVQGRIERIAKRYDLSDDEALAVLATVRLYRDTAELLDAAVRAEDKGDSQELAAFTAQLAATSNPTTPDHRDEDVAEVPDDRAATVRATLGFLAEPAVAAAVLAEISSERDGAHLALGLFAESVEPLAPRAARPALRWLRASAYEAIGDLDTAEQTYRAAESLDPSWPLTLVALARYAADRGDAERGLALLRRAGAPRDDELVQLLQQFVPRPRPGLGRNQPCWCGSGRKYKSCHLNREQLPLAERAAWLYQKAGMDLLDGPFGTLVIEAAQARARQRDSLDALVEAVQDGLAADVTLFEGGAFADFLAGRGPLLPDDERLLAEQWLVCERSVHEVVAVRPGEGMTVRDVRTGDVHEVRERIGSRKVQVGQLFCARVVPAGDTMQIFGGIEPVAVGDRDKLIALLDDEPDPVELVELLSRRFGPQILPFREDGPLATGDATLHDGDSAAVT